MAAPSTATDGNSQAAEEVKEEVKLESEAPETSATVTEEAKEDEAAEAPASSAAAASAKQEGDIKKWSGWPGDNVFRLIVPVIKVGSIIGKKGELIKKLCEETRAKVRVLDGVVGTTDRIVLIYAKEEPEAELSPAVDAVLRVFKRINGVTDTGADGAAQAYSAPACSVRLLVPSSQAINLIGKQGSSIKSIQENTGAVIRVITGDELPYYASGEERVVDIQGEPLKVLKGLEAVVGHLRKFLVDHSILPQFERSPNAPPAHAQDHTADAWNDKAQSLIHTAQQSGMGSDYTLPLKRDSFFLERDSHLDSQIPGPGGLSSLYQPEPLPGLHSRGLGRSAGALVTKVSQTMQIPLSYAEDIIGVGGGNIAYIRRTSGAALTVQESGGLRDEITVEIKGTTSEVQTAQQLIQDFISGHKEPPVSSFGGRDRGRSSSYSHLGGSAYPFSSLTSQYGGYSSGLGGYGNYRF